MPVFIGTTITGTTIKNGCSKKTTTVKYPMILWIFIMFLYLCIFSVKLFVLERKNCPSISENAMIVIYEMAFFKRVLCSKSPKTKSKLGKPIKIDIKAI